MTITTKTGRLVGNKGGAKSRSKRPVATVTPPVPDPPTPDGNVTTAMIEFKDEFLARAEPTHPAALDDPMQREMVLMTNVLTARANCTHVAVQDGNWTATGTFLRVSNNTFEVPTANAKVGIPQGITVTYDANVDTVIDYIRCDGKFVALRGADRKLVIDTFVGCCTSDIEIGTAASPFTNIFRMEFPGSADLNPAVDEYLIGRGFLTMGKVRICGSSKVHRMKITAGMSAGATSFTAPVTPTGWAIGDELSIGSTDHLLGTGSGSNSVWEENRVEHVTITNISGTTITFTPALTYARAIPTVAGMSDIGYWIGNFTRNIKFYSPPGTLVHRRAHNMQMGADTDIRWASADLMGRTVKGTTPIRSFAATDDAMRIARMGSDIPWAASGVNSNAQGRYNWHHHRSGNFAPGDPRVRYEGITASDAVGWAVSHHESVADFDKVCTRRFAGAGMVAEIGNEVGTWSDCLSIGNVGGTVWEAFSLENIEKARIVTHYSNSTAYDNIIGTFDFARNGYGYWYRSRVVATENCAAQDCIIGFVWNSRGTGLNSPGSLTPEPRIFYGGETNLVGVSSDRVIITRFDDCESVNCNTGFFVLKANPRQWHDMRSHFSRFTAWNVRRGVNVSYTSFYSFTKNRIHLTDRLKSNGDNVAIDGFKIGVNAHNMTLIDCMVRGPSGSYGAFFVFSTTANQGPNTAWRHKVVDFDVSAGMNLLSSATTTHPWYRDEALKVGVRADFSYPPALTYIPLAEPAYTGVDLWLYGTVSDEAGSRDRNLIANPDPGGAGGNGPRIVRGDFRRMLTKYDYFTYDSSDWLLVPDLLQSSFADAVTDELTIQYSTVVVRISTYSSIGSRNDYTNRGALPQRYIDAILIGRGTPPGTPDANAGHWVVYEDALGVGGIHEGL